MKAQYLGKVRFLDHIDDASDGIKYSPKEKQQESPLWNTCIHIPNEENDHPSHHEVKERIQHSGNARNENFRQNPKERNTPDNT